MNLSQLKEIKKLLFGLAPKDLPNDDVRVRTVHKINIQVEKLEKALGNQADANNKLVIAIVGKMNTGKSSLLNAMLFNGEHVLPVAASPMTAGLTIIQYVENAEDQRFEIEYYKEAEWKFIESNYRLVKTAFETIKQEISTSSKIEIKKKFKEKCEQDGQNYESLMACYELVEKQKESLNAKMKIGKPNDVTYFNEITELPGMLTNFVSARGEYQPVVCAVHIFINSPLLTFTNESTGRLESYKIVDTPGVNDPVEARDQQAKNFLSSAHAAIMLIKADKCQTQSDFEFLDKNIVKGGMSSVLISFSKLDLRLIGKQTNDCDGDGDFYDAMEEMIGYVDGEYTETGELNEILLSKKKQFLPNATNLKLNSIATCTLAETVKVKLQNANLDVNKACLTDEEEKFLDEMKECFPIDFSVIDFETIKKLDILAGISRLKEEFLLGKFLRNKDQIVTLRYKDQNKVLSNGILEEIDKQLKEIDDKSKLAESLTSGELAAQISAIESLHETGPAELQRKVIIFISSLKGDFVRRLFNEDFVNKKPKLQSNATVYETINYKRMGTNRSIFGGNVHNETVSVERINPNSIVKTQDNQIDSLVRDLQKCWRTRLIKEQEQLVSALLLSLQNICNNGTVTINASLFTSALNDTVDECFIGRQTLDIGSWCDEKKRELESYVFESKHRTFTTDYEEVRMSKDDGDQKIENNALECLNNFKIGIRKRYDDYYDELRIQVEKECDQINTSLTSFVEDSTKRLIDKLQQIKNEKEAIMSERKNYEGIKNSLKMELADLKTKIRNYEINN